MTEITTAGFMPGFMIVSSTSGETNEHGDYLGYAVVYQTAAGEQFPVGVPWNWSFDGTLAQAEEILRHLRAHSGP